MPDDPALRFFDTLRNWRALSDLIAAGEAEGTHLECKAPTAPQLNRDLKATLAQALSGFANSNGGIVLWGVSTTRHTQSGLDVITQLTPIANASHFAKQVDTAIPTLAYPTLTTTPSRVVRERPTDTRGIVVTHIPVTAGDPVQSLTDKRFYIRSGDDFVEMPYEMLGRMFASTQAPDLRPKFDARLIKRDGLQWTIPLLVENLSSAATGATRISLEVLNHSACDSISIAEFNDVAGVNPGKRLFTLDRSDPIFRGMNEVLGNLIVTMKRERRPRRLLQVAIGTYSTNMRARRHSFTVHLTQRGFAVRGVKMDYYY